MGDHSFQAWLDEFFASYYRHRPVNATFVGEHAYDHLLPDCSPAGVEGALADAATLLRAAGTVDEAGLDPVQRLDKRLAEGFLRIQQWEFQSNHFQRGNPSLYTGEAIFGVMSLFLNDFAPATVRVEAAIERLYAVGKLLAEGEHAVKRAPLAWTQRALRECAGAQAFLARGVDLLTEPTAEQRPALRRAADAALAAFARFDGYLRNELSHMDAPDYACGGEAFELLLRDGHDLHQSAAAIEEYAWAQLVETRRILDEQARTFGVTTWTDALAQLSELHPTVDTYLDRYRELWDASRTLAAAQNLLTWPDFPLAYVPQPAWARAAAPSLYFLFYRAPAAFNRPPLHKYLVTPIDKSLAADEQQRRLRSNNDSVIKLNHVVHHGGIGHHVQNWHAYHGASRIGQVAAVDCASRIAMFCGATMAEGWACYATTLMGEAGFLTPLEKFSEYQTDLRMCARAIVDIRLHHGRMTLAEAAAFYAEHTGMSLEASTNEAVKNSMFPGAALIYVIGRDQILDLRQELRRRQGASFDLKAFHDRFLAYGSVPVAAAAAAMREELNHAQ